MKPFLLPIYMLATLLIAVMCVTLPGCDSSPLATPEGRAQVADMIAAQREQAQQITAELPVLTQQVESLNAQIEAIEDETVREPLIAARDKAVEVLSSAQATVDGLNATVKDLEELLRTADSEVDVYAQGVGVIGQHLPPPYNTYALLAASILGIGGTIIKSVQASQRLKQLQATEDAAESVIQAIEQVKAENSGAVNFTDPQTKTELRSRMTEGAKALVEDARS
ncbi:MAG: hypothetical protein IT445_00050 [Phycisphaeraceae bacterium]|nr:hypothetical protein [Phycisphaeraceae bacterium]